MVHNLLGSFVRMSLSECTMPSTRAKSRPPRNRPSSSRRVALPETPGLMLCTLVADPFDSPDWIFEPKYDGLRLLVRFDGWDVRLLSRNNLPQDFQFPDVGDTLLASLTRPAILDGEVVCFDEHGRSSFRHLQQRFHLKDQSEIQERMERFPAYLYLFDILYWDGDDLTR